MKLSEAEENLRLRLSGDAEYHSSRVVDIINETDEAFYLQVLRKNAELEHFQCWRVDKKTGSCKQRPHWESEMMGGGPAPNPKACETCMFRPSEFNGVKLDRASDSSCQIYEYPESKPKDVYWEGADCEFYEMAE
jgi:hypothetical protein